MDFRIAQQMGLVMKAGGRSQSYNLKCLPGAVKFIWQFRVRRQKPPTSICNCQLKGGKLKEYRMDCSCQHLNFLQIDKSAKNKIK
jgi:hypothetical protein